MLLIIIVSMLSTLQEKYNLIPIKKIYGLSTTIITILQKKNKWGGLETQSHLVNMTNNSNELK